MQWKAGRYIQIGNEAENQMVKILNYWNNLLGFVPSPLSPEHIKIKIKKNGLFQAQQHKV